VKRAGVTPTLKQRPSQPRRAAQVKRIVRIVAGLFAVIVIVDALIGDRGLLAMRQSRKQYDELTAAIAKQRAENERLRDEIRRLHDDPGAIEELARRELGLIRPGEKVFIVKDLETPPSH
jgi:cell division protein FtsB